MKATTLFFLFTLTLPNISLGFENPCENRNLDDYSSSVCEDACLPALPQISKKECKGQRVNLNKCLLNSSKCLELGQSLKKCEDEIIRKCYTLHH